MIASRWLERDPPAAMTWLAGLPAGEVREQAMSASFRSWWGENPQDAEQWLRSDVSGDGVDIAIEMVIRASEDDPAAATRWASELRNEKARVAAIVPLGRAWLRSDREAAVAWFAMSEIHEKTKSLILSEPMVRDKAQAKAKARAKRRIKRRAKNRANRKSQEVGPVAAPAS